MDAYLKNLGQAGAWALLLFAAACSSDNLVLPAEGDPGSIEALAGDGQRGVVGGALTESLVVRVTDIEGRPIRDQLVTFVLAAGLTGQLDPDTARTDGAGRAATLWRLGTVSGEYSAQALVAGVPGNLAANFTATADPDAPDTLILISGDDQTGQVGTELAESLVVRLADQFGNPIVGADIHWATQDGSLSSAVVTTGPDGRASVLWTLGSPPGGQQATASFSGVSGSPASFSSTALVGPPPRLVILTEPSGTAQSGVPLTRQPRLQVQDNVGNPIQQGGVAVTATLSTGGGNLGGTTTEVTNANGVVQFTDLSVGGPTGTRTILFAASGHTSALSAEIDITPGPPSPASTTITVSPGMITASTGSSASTIRVTARDAFSNPVAGVDVVLFSTGTGNNLTQPQGPTPSNGVATGSLASTVAETKTVSVTIDGAGANQTRVVIVNPGPLSPGSSTAVVPAGKVFQATAIAITGRDTFGNRISTGGASVVVRITGANPRNSVTVTDNGDGTYSASYTPVFLGTDTINITMNGIAISGNPYASTVGF